MMHGNMKLKKKKKAIKSMFTFITVYTPKNSISNNIESYPYLKNGLLLFREIMGIYCKIHMKNK